MIPHHRALSPAALARTIPPGIPLDRRAGPRGTHERADQQVVDGSIEFAILSDVTAQDRKKWSLHVRELFREPLMLAVPSTHPLASATQAPKPENCDRKP